MSGDYFHCQRETIKRSAGRSVVAAAAYRTATSIECEREGIIHDYTRKRGVKESFVTTPEAKAGCEWAQDIGALTNAMEAAEKRKDAQVGHEFTIALPAALDDPQRSALSHALSQKLSDLYGVAVIGAIHAPSSHGDQRNEHLHLLFTTREVEADGKLGAKVTSITDRKTAAAEVSRYRELVAQAINGALSDAGFGEEEFVDHRSFLKRGIERTPTTHNGVAVTAYERRGVETERHDINRAIIEERIEAQQALAEALARQGDDTPPRELTLETERELAKRFGEEWVEDKRGLEAAVEADSDDKLGLALSEEPQTDSVLEGMQPELERLETTGTTLPHPKMWAWVRPALERFRSYLRDERGHVVAEGASGWFGRLFGRDAGDVAGMEHGKHHRFTERVGTQRGGGEPPAGDLPRPGGEVGTPEPGIEPQSLFDALTAAFWAEPWPEEDVTGLEPEVEPEPEPDAPDQDDAPDLW